MGHDRRFEKVTFLLLKKRFYAGLFILLPAFFFLFSSGAFLLVMAKLAPLTKKHAAYQFELIPVYSSLKAWGLVFGAVALISGIIVAYALLRPARRLLRDAPSDIDEFGALGAEFRDMASSLKIYISTLENITGGVLTTNRAGLITMANKQASEILGMEQEKLIGSKIDMIFDISGESEEALAGNAVNSEIFVKEGSARHLMGCAISPIRGARGIEGMVFNFRDITRIKQMHKELQKTQRLASIGSLTMEVAHEVRNPLASIKGLAQLISEEIKEDDPKKQYIDTIVKEANRLNRVIDNLYRKRTQSFEGESLKEMLHRAVLMSNEAEKEKGVKITEDYDEKTASFTVKDESVFQGLYNIILNAYEAVPPGGEVVVKTTRGEGAIEVTVISGSTMDDEISGKVFDSDVTTKGAGRGIGLKIANDVIRSAGGTINLRKDGDRIKFIVRLPENKD